MTMWQKVTKQNYAIDYVDKLMPTSRYSGHPSRLTFDNDDVVSNLNLIVKRQDGSKRRYYVMGDPYRKYVKQFAEHSGIPVVEINMGMLGRIDIDLETAEKPTSE